MQMQAEQKTSKFSEGTDFFQYPGGSTIKFLIRQLPLKIPNSQQVLVQDISTSYI